MDVKMLLAGLAMVAAAPALAQPAAPKEPPAAPAPSLAQALAGAQAALAECAAAGWPHVAAAVLDSAGETKVALTADGTSPGHAVPRSVIKAATALHYRVSSAEIQKRATSDPAFAKEIEADPRLLAKAGGEPIIIDGVFLGAIGVSGAPGADKDAQCARAGLARIVGR